MWQNEFSYVGGSFNAAMTGTGGGLELARRIHDNLALVNASTFLYLWLWEPQWYYQTGAQGNGGLFGTDDGFGNRPSAKRAYVMGNFSKFVRPGAVRIAATGAPTGLAVSAYLNPSGLTAIVAINASVVNQTLAVTGMDSASMVNPWITDATRDLVDPGRLPVSAGAFTYSVPPRSVVTLMEAPFSAHAGVPSSGSVVLSGNRAAGSPITVTRR